MYLCVVRRLIMKDKPEGYRPLADPEFPTRDVIDSVKSELQAELPTDGSDHDNCVGCRFNRHLQTMWEFDKNGEITRGDPLADMMLRQMEMTPELLMVSALGVDLNSSVGHLVRAAFLLGLKCGTRQSAAERFPIAAK